MRVKCTDFCSKTVEVINCQQIRSKINDKGNSQVQRKLPDGNLKGIKRTRIQKYTDKYKRDFSQFKFL